MGDAMNNKIAAFTVAGVLAAALVVSGIVYLSLGIDGSSTWMTGSVAGSAEATSADAYAAGDAATASEDAAGPYEPTSEYIAEGFDPDERLVDFSDSEPAAGSGPRVDILTTSDVQRIVYNRANDLIPCYQKTLDGRPDATGRVHFRFGIDPSGEVVMVRIPKSGLESTVAEDCMVEKTRRWEFPETGLEIVTRFKTSMMFRLN
jgi:hypothetical protein